MSPALFVFLSGCLTFGVPLILAIRELVVLRRGGGGGGGWHPPPPQEGPRPLPPCLLVPPRPYGPMEETSRSPVPETV